MAWHTLTDAEITILIRTRINVECARAGIVAGVIDDSFRHGAVA